MGDIVEAIQNLSIGLSERIGRLSGAHGWAYKPYSWISADRDRFFQIVATVVSFPGGFHASFTPRHEATGNTWFIDIKRTDGRVRDAWANGLRVSRAEKGWAILGDHGPLNDEYLSQMLEELAS